MVTYNGDPVEGATIRFQPISGADKGAVGQSNADGSFTLTTYRAADGALPGEFAIGVTKKETVDTLSEEEKLKLQEQGRPVPSAKTTNHLPEKYANPKNSGLKATITLEGDNTVTLDLTD